MALVVSVATDKTDVVLVTVAVATGRSVAHRLATIVLLASHPRPWNGALEHALWVCAEAEEMATAKKAEKVYASILEESDSDPVT